MSSTSLFISAAIILNPQQQMLLVRKKGTVHFMQAGGKIEAGEQPEQAVIRELNEELGINASADNLQYQGEFHAVAANEPDHTVEAHIYLLQWSDPISVGAEIEESIWVSPRDALNLLLAPLTRQFIVPLVIARQENHPAPA